MTRHAVITGATGGLGGAVVKRFLSAGYGVIAVDVRPDADEWLAGMGHPEQLRYRQLDVMDPAAVQKLAGELRVNPAGLDVLVNLVGGFVWAGIMDTDAETLDRMLDLNVRSTYTMTRGLLPLLNESEHGRVINVGARQALAGGPNVTAYALSKAAVVNFTQSLAAELKESSVTVNAVVPSIIDTPANRRDMPQADFDAWVEPADLAHVIHFLASEEARAVSGAILPVYHKA
ncbi:MAG: SDR family NAD(P)-dependent oxidoreductase [Candidatus Sericytochromatia bacterium]